MKLVCGQHEVTEAINIWAKGRGYLDVKNIEVGENIEVSMDVTLPPKAPRKLGPRKPKAPTT